MVGDGASTLPLKSGSQKRSDSGAVLSHKSSPASSLLAESSSFLLNYISQKNNYLPHPWHWLKYENLCVFVYVSGVRGGMDGVESPLLFPLFLLIPRRLFV